MNHLIPAGLLSLALITTGCAPNDAPAPNQTTVSQEGIVNYDGAWKDDTGTFEAEVAGKEIAISIVGDSTKSLYWKGTFPLDGSKFVSVGDTEAMSRSMMGSLDADKDFERTDDSISFNFTMMGTTKTVRLTR